MQVITICIASDTRTVNKNDHLDTAQSLTTDKPTTENPISISSVGSKQGTSINECLTRVRSPLTTRKCHHIEVV